MRTNLVKKKSTKPERIFYEILKKHRIPFKFREKIKGREIDFILYDKVCVEIDGHNQDSSKNEELIRLGYIPLHIRNNEIYKKRKEIEKWLQTYLISAGLR